MKIQKTCISKKSKKQTARNKFLVLAFVSFFYVFSSPVLANSNAQDSTTELDTQITEITNGWNAAFPVAASGFGFTALLKMGRRAFMS